MSPGLLGRAIAIFAVTNVDDLLILALFFSRTTNRAGVTRVVIGQYLGFTAILVFSIIGALGAGLLADSVIPYLGLLPLLLGIRAAWNTWRQQRFGDHDEELEHETSTGARIPHVAAVTFANSGDNIGVYVPVFATAGAAGMARYAGVFLVGVAVWCAAGRFFATRPMIAKALARWGHIVMPLALIGIGAFILIEGGAFGL
jgi:cadmium resistance protein CadD (predicted permease)